MAQEIRMALLRDKVRELEEVLASRDKVSVRDRQTGSGVAFRSGSLTDTSR